MRSATCRRVGKDPDYLSFVHTLPCVACQATGLSQTSVTEAAHVGPRGLSQKCPDRETLPLCAEHHRLNQFSQHSMGRLFWKHYGLDRDELLALYQARFDADRLGTVNPMEILYAENAS